HQGEDIRPLPLRAEHQGEAIRPLPLRAEHQGGATLPLPATPLLAALPPRIPHLARVTPCLLLPLSPTKGGGGRGSPPLPLRLVQGEQVGVGQGRTWLFLLLPDHPWGELLLGAVCLGPPRVRT
ncbi:unnamed protein product, partial [Closterium sp. NIES-53]